MDGVELTGDLSLSEAMIVFLAVQTDSVFLGIWRF